MARRTDVLEAAAAVARTAAERDVKYPAVALAYYAFVSFAPLSVFVFAVAGEQFVFRLHAATPRLLTPAAQELIYEATTSARGRGGAVVLAVAVLAWSGANVAVDFQTVVERVEDASEASIADQLRDGVVVLGSLAAAIVAIVLTSAASASFGGGPVITVIGLGLLFVALAAAFVPLYYVPSRMVESLRAALPGALAAAFSWTVLHAGILFYAANATRYAVYGVLSGIIVILTSLYLAAGALMIGVVVNAVLTGEIDVPPETEGWPWW